MWLWWHSDDDSDLDLDRIWRAYLRRFDIEHTFRFTKQVLGWTTPKLRTPEQADRWTWLILAAFTQLRLARPLVGDYRLPWQPRLPARQLTPGLGPVRFLGKFAPRTTTGDVVYHMELRLTNLGVPFTSPAAIMRRDVVQVTNMNT